MASPLPMGTAAVLYGGGHLAVTRQRSDPGDADPGLAAPGSCIHVIRGLHLGTTAATLGGSSHGQCWEQ